MHPMAGRLGAALALLVLCLGACRAAEELFAPPSLACKEPLADSFAPPAGATVATVLNGTVTRTYTCPNDDAYEFATELRTKDGELVGSGAGQSEDPLRVYYFFAPGGSPEEAVATITNDVGTAVKLDLDDDADWERRPVLNATGAAEGAAWIVRTDTKGDGGVSCDGVADGEEAVGVYTAVYTFYSCLE